MKLRQKKMWRMTNQFQQAKYNNQKGTKSVVTRKKICEAEVKSKP